VESACFVERVVEADRARALEHLTAMLKQVLKLRRAGASFARLGRAQAYVDGYMRALMESGLTDKQELLALVRAERAHADGPATVELEPAPFDLGAPA
jgi:hypothetical protein